MAVMARVLATKPTAATSGATHLYYYVCDTFAELPTTSLAAGEMAVTLDSTPPRHFIAISATEWSETNRAMPSGYSQTYYPPLVMECRTTDPGTPLVGMVWLRTDL